MNKIAVFGKPGSGKSTISKRLAEYTGIQLYQLDSIIYKKNGDFVDPKTVEEAHKNILFSESWIIDGMGSMKQFYERLNAADTLVYIDLPYFDSYWFVTKRLLKSLVVKPEGWPDGSSVVKGTLNSYKTLRLCPKFWNEDFRKKLAEISKNKTLFVISSVSDLDNFIERHVAV